MVRPILTSNNQTLRQILKTCQTLTRQTRQVVRALPAPLRPHVTVVSYHSGVLTLAVPNSTWGTQLRYHFPELIAALQPRAEFAQLKTCHCRIVPQATRKTAAKAPLHLSSATGTLLQDVAEGVEDKALSEALRRLARHSRTT